jgi:hypothetical protein
MSVPSAYLATAKSIKSILADLQKASVPPKFTYDFLKQLGHPSSSNRPVIGVLKALRFLTDGGEPTERYRRFKSLGQAKAVMAEGLRDAYVDVFAIDQQAHQRSSTELKDIFARLSGKGDSVNEKMAMTFKTLAEMADFKAATATAGSDGEVASDERRDEAATQAQERESGSGVLSLRHDIHIHLPPSTNVAVYDAIFRSMRDNLL